MRLELLKHVAPLAAPRHPTVSTSRHTAVRFIGILAVAAQLKFAPRWADPTDGRRPRRSIAVFALVVAALPAAAASPGYVHRGNSAFAGPHGVFRVAPGTFKPSSGDFRIHKGTFTAERGTYTPTGGSAVPKHTYTPPAQTYRIHKAAFSAKGDFRVQPGTYSISRGFLSRQ